MNKKLLGVIARWLEGGAKHERIEFDMSKGVYVATGEDYETDDPAKLRQCNTSCCIAGAAVTFSHKGDVGYLQRMLDGGDPDFTYGKDGNANSYGIQAPWWRIHEEAKQALDLEDSQANRLFMPDIYGPGGSLSDYDAAWAARTIRRLIATGFVDWEATRYEEVEA